MDSKEVKLLDALAEFQDAADAKAAIQTQPYAAQLLEGKLDAVQLSADEILRAAKTAVYLGLPIQSMLDEFLFRLIKHRPLCNKFFTVKNNAFHSTFHFPQFFIDALRVRYKQDPPYHHVQVNRKQAIHSYEYIPRTDMELIVHYGNFELFKLHSNEDHFIIAAGNWECFRYITQDMSIDMIHNHAGLILTRAIEGNALGVFRYMMAHPDHARYIAACVNQILLRDLPEFLEHLANIEAITSVIVGQYDYVMWKNALKCLQFALQKFFIDDKKLASIFYSAIATDDMKTINILQQAGHSPCSDQTYIITCLPGPAAEFVKEHKLNAKLGNHILTSPETVIVGDSFNVDWTSTHLADLISPCATDIPKIIHMLVERKAQWSVDAYKTLAAYSSPQPGAIIQALAQAADEERKFTPYIYNAIKYILSPRDREALLSLLSYKVCDWCTSMMAKTFICSRCNIAFYHSQECQQKHWQDHQTQCKKGPPTDPPPWPRPV